MSYTNIRQIDLNLIVVFDALYETLSVTRAAERLNLTQPTVSGLLRRLRALLGDALFTRTSHGILPTPRAEALAAPVREIVLASRALLVPEVFDPATEDFTVRLCGSDYLQLTILTDFTRAILARAPGARVSVLPRPASGLPEQLARGEMDMVLSIADVAIPDFPARRLYHDAYVCMTSVPGCTDGQHVPLEVLTGAPHAFVDPTGGSFRGPIDAQLQTMGLSRRVVLAVPTFAMLRNLMETTPLFAFAPRRVVESQFPGVPVVTTDVPSPDIEVLASWHPRMARDPRHMWLRETLVQAARESGAETYGNSMRTLRKSYVPYPQ